MAYQLQDTKIKFSNEKYYKYSKSVAIIEQ